MMTLVTLSSMADSWKVEGGTGVWRVGSEGTISDTIKRDTTTSIVVTDTLDQHEDSDQVYLYLLIKHPLPVVPNVRFEYVKVTSEGKSATVNISTFGGSGSSSSSNVESDLSLTQYDMILYYNLLDKRLWTTIDVGLDLKYVDSQYSINSFQIDEASSSITPLLYVRGRVNIPVVDIGVEADGKYITDGTSTLYDARIKVDYTMNFVPVVQPRVELGYRMQRFDVDSQESSIIGAIFTQQSKVDMSFSGFYAGIGIVF